MAAGIEKAAPRGRTVSICGGCHSMGAEVFGTDAVLIDVRSLDDVHRLDTDARIVEDDAGIQWPALIAHLNEVQPGRLGEWAIAQKQTGPIV